MSDNEKLTDFFDSINREKSDGIFRLDSCEIG